MATLTQSAMAASPCAASNASPGRHYTMQAQSHTSPPPSTSPSSSSGHSAFAFARIHNDVCLVQTDASLTNSKRPLLSSPVELAVFRHEFGTMFRLARRARLPAQDVQLLAPLDEAGVLCDAESGVVFLAREMTNQLLRYTSPTTIRRVQNVNAIRRRY